jgi:predicted methyltransferase
MEGFQELTIHLPKNIANRIEEISKQNGKSTIETIVFLLNLALDPELQEQFEAAKQSPGSSISDS